MANTIEKQVLVNGPRELIVKVHLDGDGSGDESGTLLIDASAYDATDLKIMRIQSAFSGFTAELIWSGSPNVHCFNIPDYDVNQDFRYFGGLINNATAKTGDILLNTTSLGNGDTGHVIIAMEKRNI